MTSPTATGRTARSSTAYGYPRGLRPRPDGGARRSSRRQASRVCGRCADRCDGAGAFVDVPGLTGDSVTEGVQAPIGRSSGERSTLACRAASLRSNASAVSCTV